MPTLSQTTFFEFTRALSSVIQVLRRSCLKSLITLRKFLVVHQLTVRNMALIWPLADVVQVPQNGNAVERVGILYLRQLISGRSVVSFQ